MRYKYVLPISLSLLLAAPLWAADHTTHKNTKPNEELAPNLDPKPQPIEQAQSLQISTLADGKMRVDFSYQDQANTQQKFSFEGSRAEILQQVQNLKTLPEPHKQTLLQALNEKPNAVFTSQFGALDPFNDPFFKNDAWMNQMIQQLFQQGAALSALPPASTAPSHNQSKSPSSIQKHHPQTQTTEPTKVWL